MRFPGSHVWTVSAVIALCGVALAAALVAESSTAHAHIRLDYCPASAPCTPPPPTPSPTPTPSPIPVNAFISIDVTSGPPNTIITVNGSAFLPNESTSLYWDVTNHVAGASNADANGNFTTKVMPFAGDTPGVHKLCASVAPNPCATFNLQAAPASPSPSTSPSPDTSPSPSPSPSESPSPTPVPATINGIDLILKPPFVILPIIGAAGLALALGYWILTLLMRPRTQTLKSVTVAHVASRPDYSAGFGTPPPAPAPAAPEPSAWAEPVAPHAATARPETPPHETEPGETAPADAAPFETAPAETSAFDTAPPDTAADEHPPAVDEPTPASPDEPPDLPEPGEY
jgi:hypothetical protein